jgi:hypothetical protein
MNDFQPALLDRLEDDRFGRDIDARNRRRQHFGDSIASERKRQTEG